jgi:hypothetical protein
MRVGCVCAHAEVTEYARWLGVKAEEDTDLLWIAREGLTAPLPENWKPCRDEDGEIYYFNFKTAESEWDHPCDSIFRNRVETERAKLLEKGRPAEKTGQARQKKGALPVHEVLRKVKSKLPALEIMEPDNGITGGTLSKSPSGTLVSAKELEEEAFADDIEDLQAHVVVRVALLALAVVQTCHAGGGAGSGSVTKVSRGWCCIWLRSRGTHGMGSHKAPT